MVSCKKQKYLGKKKAKTILYLTFKIKHEF